MTEHDDRSGSELGGYQLKRLIGRGGMGVVYEAHDNRLGRTVALKILPPEVVQDVERRARFEREAKALAALKHSGIVTIYSFETVGADTFFTMDLVEGRTLTEVMREEGAMSVARILELGIPIADALAAAHRRGIAHRDVKPDNIIIGPRGEVTILDFGLAKLSNAVVESAHNDADLTASIDATIEGRILGTIHYMAPEQAQGAETNPTTDVFALGVVLYEMATGLTPFPGDNTVSKLSSILKDEPVSIHEHNASLPRELERLIRRCLAKDPDRRWQNAVDVRNELELLRDELANPRKTPTSNQQDAEGGRSGQMFIVSAVLVILAVVFGFGVGVLLMNLGESTVTPTTVVESQPAAPRCVSVTGPAGYEILEAEIDPDASRIAMVTRKMKAVDQSESEYEKEDRRFLFMRDLNDFETRLIPGSQRIAAGNFSPDGSSYIFVKFPTEANLPAKLMRLSLDTDLPPVQIGTVPYGILGYEELFDTLRGFVWLNDNTLAFVTDDPYQVVTVNAKTGDEENRIPIEFQGMWQPTSVLSPLDEERFLLATNYYDERGYMQDVLWVDATTGETGVLIEGSPNAMVVPGNRLLFSKGETLYQAGYDPSTRAVAGEAAPVFTDLRTTNSWDGGDFHVAADGTLVHLPGGLQGGRRTLVRVDTDGEVVPLKIAPRAFEEAITVSADGEQVIVTNTNDDNAMWDLWSGTLEPPRIRRLVSYPSRDVNSAVLSADGSCAIARQATTQPKRQIDVLFFPLNDVSEPRVLHSVAVGDLIPLDIHPDKDRILMSRYNATDELSVLYEVGLESGAEPVELSRGSTRASMARWSPDGRLLGFTSDESGVPEIHVGLYGSNGLTRVVPASDGRAENVAWSVGDDGGMRLHYFANGVEHRRDVILDGDRFTLGPIMKTGRTIGDDVTYYALDRQGRIFAVQKGANEVPATRVEVISGRFTEGSS